MVAPIFIGEESLDTTEQGWSEARRTRGDPRESATETIPLRYNVEARVKSEGVRPLFPIRRLIGMANPTRCKAGGSWASVSLMSLRLYSRETRHLLDGCSKILPLR